ncbi:MAG: hypothetical protein B6242_09755 [Anaerolineaceae bacterium 4572_78]|nr:MAG: hypothetical protein B6242_09755 [Anaerolineaceae bacterium 4572_78]
MLFNINPFQYGKPVSAKSFFGYERALRTIVQRILNNAQSSAIISEPRMGKTSLLHFLKSAELRRQLPLPIQERLIFSGMDMQAFDAKRTVAHFWERALVPIHEQLIEPVPDSPLAKQYNKCYQKNFAGYSYEMERFFEMLYNNNKQLVLLLDEFDTVLHHTRLNCAEFYAGLRSLASRSTGGLSVVTASRLSLTEL